MGTANLKKVTVVGGRLRYLTKIPLNPQIRPASITSKYGFKAMLRMDNYYCFIKPVEFSERVIQIVIMMKKTRERENTSLSPVEVPPPRHSKKLHFLMHKHSLMFEPGIPRYQLIVFHSKITKISVKQYATAECSRPLFLISVTI